jgi:parvulin-like peptidyl-prolyl isomerase
MKHFPLTIIATITSLFLAGCGSSSADSAKVTEMRKAIAELEKKAEHTAPRVTVRHILIGFEGSVPSKGIKRSRQEAEELAAELFSKIQSGADFDSLIKEHTDDSYPGEYTMTSNPASAVPPQLPRSSMVPGFGHVGWRLEVGEVGVSPYDPVKSQFGWHIIKRLR